MAREDLALCNIAADYARYEQGRAVMCADARHWQNEGCRRIAETLALMTTQSTASVMQAYYDVGTRVPLANRSRAKASLTFSLEGSEESVHLTRASSRCHHHHRRSVLSVFESRILSMESRARSSSVVSRLRMDRTGSMESGGRVHGRVPDRKASLESRAS
eukprot:1128040-Rhodomonas_salina.1